MYPVKCLWLIAFIFTNSMEIQFLYTLSSIIGLNDVRKELELIGITDNLKKEDIRFKIIKK